MIKICENCGEKFEGRNNKKYCTQECKGTFENNNIWEEYKWRTELPTGTIGAISEVLVCADLMKKGYEVFRAISPACSCDIIILDNGYPKRIEVRTGRRNPNTNKISYSKDGKYDILAIVLMEENLIFYEPLLGDEND